MPFNTDLLDHSTTNQFTANDGGVTLSTAQSKFGGTSAYFNGALNSKLRFQTLSFPTSGPFSIEFWLRPDATIAGNTAFFGWRQGGSVGFSISGTSTGYYVWHNGTTHINVTAGGPLQGATWYHLAVCRDGSNNLRMFLNGALVGTKAAFSSAISFPEVEPTVGSDNPTFPFQGNFLGHIDDVLVTNTAKYTAAFTTPTTPQAG
jgi:hypothetical protein